jgi:uncharacterized membrane protein YagU involved in acid resistance
MDKLSLSRAISAGILGTLAMTVLTFIAPMMGMPEMNIPKMLAGTMGLPNITGWLAHFMIGILLAIFYAAFFYNVLPGVNVVKGMVYSIFPWLMAQLLVMPMTGTLNGMPFTSGLFSGSFIMAAGSLMGHLIYGLVIGALYHEKIHVSNGFFAYESVKPWAIIKKVCCW